MELDDMVADYAMFYPAFLIVAGVSILFGLGVALYVCRNVIPCGDFRAMRRAGMIPIDMDPVSNRIIEIRIALALNQMSANSIEENGHIVIKSVAVHWAAKIVRLPPSARAEMLARLEMI